MPHVCGYLISEKNIDLLSNKLESQRGKEPTNWHALTGSIEYLKIGKKTPLNPPQNIVYPVENTRIRCPFNISSTILLSKRDRNERGERLSETTGLSFRFEKAKDIVDLDYTLWTETVVSKKLQKKSICTALHFAFFHPAASIASTAKWFDQCLLSVSPSLQAKAICVRKEIARIPGPFTLRIIERLVSSLCTLSMSEF